MGYYSEVKIVCEGEAFKLFKAAWERFEFFRPHYIEHNSEFDIYSFGWHSWKWYEEFPEVRAIEDVKLQLDDMSIDIEGYDYRYVRLGEDPSDIDIENHGYGDLPYLDIVIKVEDCIEFEKWEEE